MPSVRVGIADGSDLYRSALRSFLALRTPEIHIIGEARDYSETLTLVAQARPDMLLLGVDSAWSNSSAVLHYLQAIGSPVHVVILSAYDEPEFRQKALDNGAAACLVKSEVAQCLIETILGVLEEKRGEQPETAHRAVNLVARGPRVPA